MIPRSHSLAELVALSGFDRRTIVYYIQSGLLPKVGRRGPHTRYPEECLTRLQFIKGVKALQAGADGVLVSGCHPGECHYLTGNLSARRKFATLKRFLSYIGVEGDRTMFTWVSASEGERFSQVIKGVTEAVRALGPARKLVKQL